jgi:hypothetical protein
MQLLGSPPEIEPAALRLQRSALKIDIPRPGNGQSSFPLSEIEFFTTSPTDWSKVVYEISFQIFYIVEVIRTHFCLARCPKY